METTRPAVPVPERPHLPESRREVDERGPRRGGWVASTSGWTGDDFLVMSLQQAASHRAAAARPAVVDAPGHAWEPGRVPTLVLNPRDDAEYVAFAERVMADWPMSLNAFQARLRERYPRAVVRPRELSSERVLVWYCYRDGRWTRSG